MFLTKDNVLRSLQGWVFVVGLMALGNTISCYVDHSFLASRLYTGAPDRASDLAARLFGIWTLMSALLRLSCAVLITNRALFNLTLMSFVVVILHYLSEVFVYQTGTLIRSHRPSHDSPFGLSPFPKCIIIMCLPVPVSASSCYVFFTTYYRLYKFMYRTV